jgi:phosphoserine aminotransferase
MARSINFSAGPATLPLATLQQAQAEFLDFDGCGTSIMEQSHRGPVYDRVHNAAIERLERLLDIPDSHQVVFLQGGASQQFAMIPMNFLPADGSADYLVTGAWGEKAWKEAQLVAEQRGGSVRLVNPGGAKPAAYNGIQAGGTLDPDAAYLHMASNETIHGVQFDGAAAPWPETGEVPLICDMSSDFLWQPTDVSRFAMIYAGAQKNLGPSGVVICVVRKDLLERCRTDLPTIFKYATHASKNSLYNTPPTFAIYMVGKSLEWLEAEGGLAAIALKNRRKAARLYSVIDGSDFYSSPVDRTCRSVMNVVWNLPTEALEKQLISEATEAGMSGLKGHRSLGGLRASIYNACPEEWVESLAGLMIDFEERNG